MKCERCDAQPDSPYGLWDYCADCSKNLCDDCMDDGCCGRIPARSGTFEDNNGGDDEEDSDDDDE